MTPVYIVGPAGSGKSTIAKALKVEDVDIRIEREYPETWAEKPWRYWITRQGSRAAAEEWEKLQSRLVSHMSTVMPYIISHPNAFIYANKPKGPVILLRPRIKEALKQRRSDPEMVNITRLSQKHWEESKNKLIAKHKDWPIYMMDEDSTADDAANLARNLSGMING